MIPICLPVDHESDENYFGTSEDQDVFVAGWGATEKRGFNPADTLQHLLVPIFNKDKCKDIYEVRGGDLDINDQMCAGGIEGKDRYVRQSYSLIL